MKLKPIFIFFTLLIVQLAFSFENEVNTDKSKNNFIFRGRVEQVSINSAFLISSASSVTFSFKGTSTDYYLSTNDSFEHDNYFVLELDGQYKGRYIIKPGNAQKFSVESSDANVHVVTIYKATEAAN